MLINSFFNLIKIERTVLNGLDACIRLNPNHKIFQAHFPGQPVTPGACEIQIVMEILSTYFNQEVYLTDLKSVKYMSVISPKEHTELTVHFQKIIQEDDTCKVSVVFQKNELIFSKMSMTCHVVRNHSNIQ